MWSIFSCLTCPSVFFTLGRSSKRVVLILSRDFFMFVTTQSPKLHKCFFLEDFAKYGARSEKITKQGTIKENVRVLPLQNIAFHFLSVYRFPTGIFSDSYNVRKVGTKSLYYLFYSCHLVCDELGSTNTTTSSLNGNFWGVQAWQWYPLTDGTSLVIYYMGTCNTYEKEHHWWC